MSKLESESEMNEERMETIAEKLADYVAEMVGVDELLRILEQAGATEDDLKRIGYGDV